MQTNGLTERFNQTLVRSLGKLANDDHDNWDDQIDMILMGYRASRQASTKFSPYYMLFQTPMRLPMDAEMAQSDDEELDEEIVICVVTDLSCDMFTMWIYPSITISDDVLLLGYDSMSKHYYSLKGKFIEKVSNIKLFQYFMPLAVTNSSMECGRYKD